ncbi:hypothetical protein SAMN04487981_104193 [Streptomyces sp. cf386]|nr:hypothetical protein SAMN04487981_104193 [Streptomyces sp. cf386]
MPERRRTHQHDRLGRVIRPPRPLRNGALYKAHSHDEMHVDRTDGRRIGTLRLLAARSPRSLVYLPMRTAPTVGVGEEDGQPLDLVLALRTVQLRPSRWKRIREHLNTGNTVRELHTASVPERDLPDLDADYIIPDNPKEANEFLLRKNICAETLLQTGGTAAFREGAKQRNAARPRLHRARGCRAPAAPQPAKNLEPGCPGLVLGLGPARPTPRSRASHLAVSALRPVDHLRPFFPAAAPTNRRTAPPLLNGRRPPAHARPSRGPARSGCR